MDTGDTIQPPADPSSDHGIRCVDCASALRSPGRETVSFLLFDRFTVPLVGCEDHLEEFTAVCELATEDSARLLAHRPAGGLPCPGCRNAAYDTQQAVVPVGNGGLALLVCSTHRSAILGRFRAGLQIRQQLDASLDLSPPDS
jgi:hypothetical protein